MKPNYFAQLIEEHQLTDKVKAKGYIPTKKVLKALREVNHPLFVILDHINPLQPSGSIQAYDIMNASKQDRVIRSFFPLTSQQVYRLDDTGASAVLEAWEEGVERTIQTYIDDLMCGRTDVSKEAVSAVFQDALLAMTERYLKKRSAFLFDHLLRTIGTQMVALTDSINLSYRQFLATYWSHCVNAKKDGDISGLVSLYRKSRIAFIEEELKELWSHNDSQYVLSRLANIERYLLFVRTPTKEILEQGKQVFDRFLAELSRLEEKKEQLAAKCKEDHDQTLRKAYKDSEREHGVLRTRLARAIEAFASVESASVQAHS